MNARQSNLPNSKLNSISDPDSKLNPNLNLNSDSNSGQSQAQSAKPLVIIPAAGFGTRVGSPEAKELISGPNGSPLIHSSLEQARKRDWPVHVITRAEKKSLIQYLKSYSLETKLPITIQTIEPSREWPETILKSQPYWKEQNLLVLPDTVYEPAEIWDSLIQSTQLIAAAVFEAPDFSKWGVFCRTSEGSAEICEKPQDEKPQMKAWGLIRFNREAGKELFQAQLESTFDHKWRTLKVSAELLPLESFEDVTRG